MTSIERTAYPRFKRLITAHELHLFFSPTRDELQWAADATDSDEHLLALLLMLKSFQRMGCFLSLEEVPEQVVEFVRRQVELPKGTLPLYRAERTAKHHRGLVRKKVGVKYDQGEARRIAEGSIRKGAEAKNRPADLINIALEKVVEAGLELPGFSTFDKMASKIRTEVNASIREGIHDRMSPVQRAGLLRLLQERDSDGTTLFNRLKKPAKGPTWSHFRNLARRLEWVDELGDTSVWMESVATGKITDFAGEADAADASELRDYAPIKQIALIACLTHKARMRVRDDLATMFCKRVATKMKKAKEELEEIREEVRRLAARSLRIVLAWIGADAPIREADIRGIHADRPGTSARRMVQFLASGTCSSPTPPATPTPTSRPSSAASTGCPPGSPASSAAGYWSCGAMAAASTSRWPSRRSGSTSATSTRS